ncbi:MAG: hypothetical protein KGJ72_03985 [Gammaproteobacteria bacterium]|nr:hypothetical protein [Gammaproteobacteria bacterium]
MRAISLRASLRTRLLVWLLGGVLLLGITGGMVVYRNALAEADAFFDYHLKETALFLRDQPVEYQFPTPIPPNDVAYDFVVQIWTIDGRRIYIGPEQAVLPNSTAIGYSTVNTSGGQWRVYGTASPTKVVQVAQPMSVRRQEAAQLAVRTLAPFALLMPLLGLLVWLAVGHALQPLQRLAKAVKARRVNALEPLSDERLPEEVQPLVHSLNDLLARLTAALDRERAFMADAAHELRTPLTALHLQLGALARAGSEPERTEAMGKLSEGVQRAIRLVEQMLALARQEPRAEPVRTRFALDELAREVVAELVPLADARRIDLGMSEAQSAFVRGERDSVATLIRNLVDNAVRYTPEGGRVDVAVERSARQAILRVMDDGPGIAREERERVFDRFYRRPGTRSPGSGLGLAIVKASAAAHGATVALGEGAGGRGLAVTVAFPQD